MKKNCEDNVLYELLIYDELIESQSIPDGIKFFTIKKDDLSTPGTYKLEISCVDYSVSREFDVQNTAEATMV